jgi:hypothetical protein
MAALMGPLRVTLWVTEKEKWPLRFTIVSERGSTDAGSFKTELNITDFNKDDIRIEAPR